MKTSGSSVEVLGSGAERFPRDGSVRVVLSRRENLFWINKGVVVFSHCVGQKPGGVGNRLRFGMPETTMNLSTRIRR
jgi:hypothetical protein